MLPWNATWQPLQVLQSLSGCQVADPGTGASLAALIARVKNAC
eukprot:COSAG06_NODE_53159_length_301_cov_1.282178_1_plen_42_part_01